LGPGRAADELELLLVEVVVEEVELEEDDVLDDGAEGRLTNAYPMTPATMISTTTMTTAAARPIAPLDAEALEITRFWWST
jgi:hypothetical protein